MSNHDEGCHSHDFDLDDNAPDDINNVHKNLLQISSPQKKDSPTEVNLHHNKRLLISLKRGQNCFFR